MLTDYDLPARTGDLVGIPYYMSPEQAQGLTGVGPEADLWAVGVIAFECVTGVRPVQAPALGRLVVKLLAGPIPLPSQAAPEVSVPPAFDAWMVQALARSPKARFGSATELAEALAQAPSPPALDCDPVGEAWSTGGPEETACVAISEFGQEILRYLRTLLPESVVDDAFSIFGERVWRSLPRSERRCSFRTWAFMIASRASVDLLRADGPYAHRHPELSESKVEDVGEQVPPSTPPFVKTPGRSVRAQLVDTLPHEDKMLLVLRVDRGLPWQDVARIFLDKESPSEAELRHESVRLRQRLHLVRMRLREVGIQVTIDVSGGQLATLDGILVVQVLPNAVAVATVFSAQRIEPPAPGLVGPAYHLEPSGTAFSLPMMLSFHYAAIRPPPVNPQALRIVTFVRGAWQPVESLVDATAQTVVASVAHFSIWGLCPIGQDAGVSYRGDLQRVAHG
jgi:DNA-directed RNA polymerase specialized sigma24 family protein